MLRNACFSFVICASFEVVVLSLKGLWVRREIIISRGHDLHYPTSPFDFSCLNLISKMSNV